MENNSQMVAVLDDAEWGEPRSRVIEWRDPSKPAALAQTMSGLEYLSRLADGTVPAPPIAGLMGMELRSVDEGRAVFALTPDESHFNPIGAVHGGVICTILDSVVGCAVHTTLARGLGYTSVEIKVNYLRGADLASGELVATGWVKKGGRRVAFAEGEIVDGTGRVVATASSTLLVFEIPA